MAEGGVTAGTAPGAAPEAAGTGGPVLPRRDAVRTYLVLVRMWSRAALQYPASLVMLGTTQLLVAALDFVAIVIVFSHTRTLAGFALPDALLLYGTSATAYGLADLAVGNIERLGRHIRTGTFDAMLVRPAGSVVQLAAEEFSPRRLGRLCTAVPVLAVAVATAHVAWTPVRMLLLPVTVVSGAAIFAAMWVMCAALQFLAGDASELVNTVLSGGSFLTQYPLVVYGRDALRAVTWIVPLAFVNWEPVLYLLDRADPLGLPAAFRFASPAVASALVLLAAAAWRAGIRRYRSTGS